MDGITDSMDMSLSKLREMVKDRVAWRAVVHGAAERGTRPRKHHTYSTETLGPQSPRRSFTDANGVKLHNVPLGPQSPRRSFTDANGVKLHNVSEVFHKIAQPQASTETPKAGAWRTCGLLLREQAEVGTPVVWTLHPPLPLLALPASPCGSSIRSS